MKVKNVSYSITVSGSGILNYNGNTTKDTEIDLGLIPKSFRGSPDKSRDNITLAKKVYRVEEKKISYETTNVDGSETKESFLKNVAVDVRLMISSACFRSALLSTVRGQSLQSIMMHMPSEMTNRLAASYEAVVRGYTVAREGDILKKKSALKTSALIQSGGDSIQVQTGSRAGARDNTSLFYAEETGVVQYKGDGFIDLPELAFISCSDLLDRRAFSADEETVFRQELSKTVGSEVSPVGSYVPRSASLTLPEDGVLLNSQQIKTLVIQTLTRLATYADARRRAHVKCDSLKVTFLGTDNSEVEFTIKGSTNFKQVEADIAAKIEGFEFDPGYVPAGEQNAEIMKLYSESVGKAKEADEKKKEQSTAAKAAAKLAKKERGKNPSPDQGTDDSQDQ